jgi:hypothetical protein
MAPAADAAAPALALSSAGAATAPWPLPAGGLASLAATASVAGFPSGVVSVPTAAGQTMNLTSSAAAAAALLGPGGLAAMLAAFVPTRVLIVINAISDGDLQGGRSALSDIVVDVAAEAQAAVSAAESAAAAAGAAPPFRYGGLLRAVTPLPRAGETLEPRLARVRTAMRHVGADGLLEDAPSTKPEFDVGGGNSKARSAAASSGALIVAPDVKALGALGRAPRNAVASAASEFLKKVGGSFSDNVTVLDIGAGRSHLGAHHQPAPERPSESQDAAQPKDATSEDAPATPGAEGGDSAGPARTRGLGRIFLEFGCADAAVTAQLALSGRFFAGKILMTSFCDADSFCAGAVVGLSIRPAPGSVVLEGEPREVQAASTVSPAAADGPREVQSAPVSTVSPAAADGPLLEALD